MFKETLQKRSEIEKREMEVFGCTEEVTETFNDRRKRESYYAIRVKYVPNTNITVSTFIFNYVMCRNK